MHKHKINFKLGAKYNMQHIVQYGLWDVLQSLSPFFTNHFILPFIVVLCMLAKKSLVLGGLLTDCRLSSLLIIGQSQISASPPITASGPIAPHSYCSQLP